jgi:beta-1,4-mannosyltransferase
LVALPYINENPYQRLLYAALADEGIELVHDDELTFTSRYLFRTRRDVGILHFHWPQGYWTRWDDGPRQTPLSWLKLALFATRLGTARILGYRIAWTIHEVRPHEPTFRTLDELGARLLARFAHALIAHDAGTIRRASELLKIPDARIALIPHGTFAGVYPPGRKRAEVREALGIRPESRVFLAFGHVRAYKELSPLLEAFASTSDPHSRLIIAGLPMDDISVELIRAFSARDQRIIPMLEFIPESSVHELFDASDVAVVTRGDGGTSGALVLALSLKKPVIAADHPDYRELAGGGAAGWFFAPGSAESLSKAMVEAGDDGQLVAATSAAADCADDLTSWSAVADATVTLVVGSDVAPHHAQAARGGLARLAEWLAPSR